MKVRDSEIVKILVDANNKGIEPESTFLKTILKSHLDNIKAEMTFKELEKKRDEEFFKLLSEICNKYEENKLVLELRPILREVYTVLIQDIINCGYYEDLGTCISRHFRVSGICKTSKYFQVLEKELIILKILVDRFEYLNENVNKEIEKKLKRAETIDEVKEILEIEY